MVGYVVRRVNIIIVLCIVVSLFCWYEAQNVQSSLLFDYLAFSKGNILSGKVWTPVTALFVHGSPLHLVGNMIFLYVFGNTLEEELKSGKTLAAFFLGGIGSFLLSLFFYPPDTSMIGASAAIFTLTAVVMLIKPLKFSFFFLMPQGLVAIIYLVYNLAAVYFGIQGDVGYISHIIGFLIGIPLGIMWSKKWKRNVAVTLALLAFYLLIEIYLLPTVLQAI